MDKRIKSLKSNKHAIGEHYFCKQKHERKLDPL